MLTSRYRYHSVHSNLLPVRLLKEDEKEYILQYFQDNKLFMHIIYDDDFYCLRLGAYNGDIICMMKNTTELYRKVISRTEVLK